MTYAARNSQFTRFAPVFVVATASLVLAGIAEAQTAGSRRPLNVSATRTSTPYACSDLTAMPTVLAWTPEGRSVVKLQRELELVAQAAAKRGEHLSELRAMVTAQRGVDSLMHVIVRQLHDSTGHATIVLSGDSVRRIAVSDVLLRGSIEAQIRELRPQIEALSMSASTVAPGASSGNGWIGLRISGSFFRETGSEGVITRYCDDYPVIEAVDAGSPAEKGGLLAGDTLLAFNSRDVLANPIVHSQVFVPGQALRVRVRRVGSTREVPIVVAESRSTFRYSIQSAGTARLLPDSISTVRPAVPVAVGGFAPARMSPSAAATVSAQQVPFSYYAREGTGLIRGAQLTVVSEDLARNLQLAEGLLVTRVHAGTPMANAGVKDGDVIRLVNGMAARNLTTVQRALESPSREARLTVLSRGQKERVVSLKW